MRFRVLLGAVWLLCASACCFQTFYGSIVGTVNDAKRRRCPRGNSSTHEPGHSRAQEHDHRRVRELSICQRTRSIQD